MPRPGSRVFLWFFPVLLAASAHTAEPEGTHPAAILHALERKQWAMAEELLNSPALCPTRLPYCQAWRLEGLTLLHQINWRRGEKNDPQLNKLLDLLRGMGTSTALLVAEHHLELAEQHLGRHNLTSAEEHLRHAAQALTALSDTRESSHHLLTREARVVAEGPQSKGLAPLLARLEETTAQTFAPDHPGRAGALLQLAGLFGRDGNTEKERHYTEQALTLLMHTDAPVHALRVKALEAMAGIHQRDGQPEQALEHLKRAQAIHEHLWGGHHPGLLSLLSRQVQLLIRLERSKAAESLLRQALEIQRATHGLESPQSAAIMVELGENLLRQGQMEAARRELLDALPMLHGQERFRLEEVRLLTALGAVLLSLGSPDPAERHLRRALGLLNIKVTEDAARHPSLLEQHGQAVAALEKQEKFDPHLWQENGKNALTAQISEVQKRLAALGMEVSTDGKPGAKTLELVRAYRHGLGLSTPGPLTPQLLRETARHLPPLPRPAE